MWISHALINHLLLQQPALKQNLSILSGHTVRITALGIHTDMLIGEEGYVHAVPAELALECQISIHLQTWTKLLQSQPFGVGDVGITGNADLAMQVLAVLGQLRYEPYLDATRLFGNTLASHLDHQAKNLCGNVQAMVQRLEGEMKDFAQEQSSPILTKDLWQVQSEAIEALRDDVARLQARLNRLQ